MQHNAATFKNEQVKILITDTIRKLYINYSLIKSTGIVLILFFYSCNLHV